MSFAPPKSNGPDKVVKSAQSEASEPPVTKVESQDFDSVKQNDEILPKDLGKEVVLTEEHVRPEKTKVEITDPVTVSYSPDPALRVEYTDRPKGD